MNETPDLSQSPSDVPPITVTDVPDRRAPKAALAFWARRLIVCNPFYLLSVALLLFGCYRISIEPALFNHEAAHLFFNFSSLQLYELLLVVTAVFLFLKNIFYDSMLLVFLDNILVSV